MRSSRREDFRSIHHSSGSIRETIFVSVLLLWGVVAALVVLSQLAVGQVLNQHDTNGPQDMSTSNAPSKIKGVVKVTVDMDKARTFMAPRAVAVNSSVSDAHLMDQNLPSQLRAAGVTTLRYPGLGYADTYHWATGKTTASSAPLALRYSGLGPNTDFGDFALMSDHVGTMVITVNYGSNQDGSGGGQPAEAAAWVAYANGNPADTKVIGKDSTGFDWQTVGYWASLRAAKPLPADDGKNILRIAHPAALNVKYWEIGNEVYKNGYYGGEGQEVDLHAPYPKELRDNEKERRKNKALSPDAYGKAAVLFIKAMKDADPRIKVGVALDSPVANKWDSQEWSVDPITGKSIQLSTFQKAQDSGLDWDKGVLQAAGKDIDFVTLHWTTGNTSQESNWKDLDNASLLLAPRDELPTMVGALLELLQKYCGQNAQNVQMLIAELGPKSFIRVPDETVLGLFAADAYLSLVEDGAANIDWSALHGGGFLDDSGKPGAAYFGVQMIHNFMAFNETLVAASSSHPLLAVHAAKHQNGSLTLMLVNKDSQNAATVKVTVSGGQLAGPGMRFDFGKSNPATGNAIAGTQVEDVSNSFTVTVPPYTITDLLIPKAR